MSFDSRVVDKSHEFPKEFTADVLSVIGEEIQVTALTV